MSTPEVSEITEPEEDRLRELLHRAAAQVPVTPAGSPLDTLGPLRVTSSRRSGRLLAVAAAVLVVVGLGAAWLLRADGDDRIETGPAEPPVTVAPEVLEQSGVWRLPEGLDGYQVAGAMDSGSTDVSATDHPGVLAVDDPDDPTRWLLIEAYDQWGEDPPTSRRVPVSDQVTAVLIDAGESIWFQMAPNGGPGDTVVSGAVRGMAEAELLGLLAQHFGDTQQLVAAGTSTVAMEAMLRDSKLDGEYALVRQGREVTAPRGGIRNLEVTLVGDDGTEVTVVLASNDQPPWAQILTLQLTAELFGMELQSSPGVAMTVDRRPDLGPDVIESGLGGAATGPVTGITAISDDGVMITAARSVAAVAAAAAASGAASADIAPLSEAEQLRILNSLRAMTEPEFRARLSGLGVDFVESTTPDGTVTTIQGD